MDFRVKSCRKVHTKTSPLTDKRVTNHPLHGTNSRQGKNKILEVRLLFLWDEHVEKPNKLKPAKKPPTPTFRQSTTNDCIHTVFYTAMCTTKTVPWSIQTGYSRGPSFQNSCHYWHWPHSGKGTGHVIIRRNWQPYRGKGNQTSPLQRGG